MMSLDYPTVLFFFVMMNIFNVALFIYQYFFHHKKWYLSVFIVGILFQIIAMILIANRSRLPFLYTVQISNFFLFYSFALTTFGIISFDGKIRKNILWSFVVFASLFYFAFLLVAENDLKRIVVQTIACSLFYGVAAFSLFFNKKKYKFSIIISTALFIYAVFQLYRAFVLYHIDQPYNFMKGSPIDNWYLIISMFVISTLRIGFIMLLKEIDQKTIFQKNRKIHREKLKIEELNKTKDKLFSIIAHDLRSPFSGVAGLSELLIKNINNWEVVELEKYLNIINTTANNTLALLDNLLNWAKSQTGQLSFNSKRIIFSDLIEEIIALATTLAKSKNITLNYSKVDRIEVFADEEMLKTVLRNLISNAIKFTRSGGHITIGAVKKQDCVEITISDNGIGMNEVMQSKIFDLSANTTTLGTANEKGSGLGLLLCKEFVERQNGKIWVESEEGKGSDFKFTLPINASLVHAD